MDLLSIDIDAIDEPTIPPSWLFWLGVALNTAAFRREQMAAEQNK
jgi:hypothetical protein